MVNIINTVAHYTRKLLRRVNPKSSHHKKKNCLSISLILYLREITDVHQTYCGNHFMMYVSQIIMLYTLNLHSAACQLNLNKTRRKGSIDKLKKQLKCLIFWNRQRWNVANKRQWHRLNLLGGKISSLLRIKILE